MTSIYPSLFFKRLFFFNRISIEVSVSVLVYVCECRWPQRSGEGVRFFGTEVTGNVSSLTESLGT